MGIDKIAEILAARGFETQVLDNSKTCFFKVGGALCCLKFVDGRLVVDIAVSVALTGIMADTRQTKQAVEEAILMAEHFDSIAADYLDDGVEKKIEIVK